MSNDTAQGQYLTNDNFLPTLHFCVYRTTLILLPFRDHDNIYLMERHGDIQKLIFRFLSV
jgi:hypothetical protein